MRKSQPKDVGSWIIPSQAPQPAQTQAAARRINPAVLPAEIETDVGTVDGTSRNLFGRLLTYREPAEVLFLFAGIIFLCIDLWIFCSLRWSEPHSSVWLIDKIIPFAGIWTLDHSPNFWECLAAAAKAIFWLLWNTLVFLAYLTTRNFLTNVGLWAVIYFTVRLKFFPDKDEPAPPVIRPVVQYASPTPPPPPTVETQNAFGDAGFATPAALGRALSGGSPANQFFED